MRTQLIIWGHGLAAAGLFSMVVMAGGCRREPGKKKEAGVAPADATAKEVEPKPDAFEATGGIDPKVIAAWEKAGARFGWEVPTFGDFDSKTPMEIKFVPKRPDGDSALPAFLAEGGSLKGLGDLPAPQAAFALHLPRSRLTEGDVKSLARFPQVRSLVLTGAEITDPSLKMIAELPRLEVLLLGGNPITDSGLKPLAGLKELKMLSVGATKVRGDGLRELAGLPKLQTLRLYALEGLDAACKEVAQLKRLRVLDVHLSKVADTGLKELAALKELELLNVAVTDVTDAAVEAFRKALPSCRVQR